MTDNEKPKLHRMIVCGGRDYSLSEYDYGILAGIDAVWPITEMVTGGCAGADTGAMRWAKSKFISVKTFLPDWAKLGKSAGPLRNQEMADYADSCVVFDGGAGTADMAMRATKKGLVVFDFRGPDYELKELL